MPRKKRPYVRKTKGCYPCARRRIHCDRTEPCCQKCAGRGLECTGLGLRVRFPYGAPQLPPSEPESTGRNNSEMVAVPKCEKVGLSVMEVARRTDLGGMDVFPMSTFEYGRGPGEFTEWSPFEEVPGHWKNDLRDRAPGDGQAFDLLGLGALSLTTYPAVLYSPLSDFLPRWKRDMCLHFSRYIATEMTAIDGLHNGWRYLVLPIAQSNELVLDAVVTVSLYHIAFNKYSTLPENQFSAIEHFPRDPNQMYNRVICGLQTQSRLNTCDDHTKTSILLTILILFVGSMVTGRNDFPLLARTLDSAIEALGGEDCLPQGNLLAFITQQMHKIRWYAAPFLDEHKGMEIVSNQQYTEQLFNSLTGQLSTFPEHSETVMFIRDIIQQAIDLYLFQVRLESKDTPNTPQVDMVSSVIRVQHFKETLEAFPAGVPQAVLVWATFVAASGSILDKHRRFFEQTFLKHYERSGFVNLLEGLEYLRKIWRRGPNENWTTLLAQARILVM